MPAACDVEFVRVNCAKLLGALREEAHAWLRGIAGLMRDADGPVAQVRSVWGAAARLPSPVRCIHSFVL